MAEVIVPGQVTLSRRDLAPGASASVQFTPQRGTVSVTPLAFALEATPVGKGPRQGGGGPMGDDIFPGGAGGRDPGDDITIRQDARVEAALFPPGQPRPEKTRTFTFRAVGQTVAPLELGVREEQAGRAWRCRFRNVGPGRINLSATVDFVRERRIEPDERPAVVAVGEEASLPATFLRPADRTELPFSPAAGLIEFTMVAFEQGLDDPPGKTLPGEDGIDEPLPVDQDVRVDVELLGPGSGRPVVSTEFRSTAVPLAEVDTEPVVTHVVGAGEADRTWRLRLTNRGDSDIRCFGTVRFAGERLRSDLPLRVLNHGLRQVIVALGLQVKIDGRTARITVSEQLARLLGDVSGPSFELPLDLPTDIDDLNLIVVGVRARADGARPVVTAHARFETRGTEIPGHGVAPVDITRLAMTVNITLRTVGRAGERELEPLVDVDVDVQLFASTLARLLARVGLIDVDVSSIADKIKREIEGFARSRAFREAVREFAGETFVRLVAPGHRFSGLLAEPGRFVVLHRQPGPDEPDTTPVQPPHVQFPRPADQEPDPLTDQERAALARIDHIVVLMQENRSFDQMLGYLSHPNHGRPRLEAEGRDIPDGLTGGESNPRSLGGQPVVATAYDDEFILLNRHRVPATAMPFSADHDHDPVLRQIAEGRMSGFVDSFIDSFPNADPGFVMRFYTDRHLPVYDRLAATYTICDQWFCSHPGPTWPNRFCALSGHAPDLRNFPIGSPIMGFLKMTNAFDVLTEAGVDWVYYENDIGFIRAYDRYRIDDRHVLPFGDPSDGFLRRADLGTLPPVTFIDPNFVDLPPLSTANDDHAPADLRRGQQLIARIHDALVGGPRWITDDGAGTLFVVTYDEHGGFFDHVAPPGTDPSDEPAVPLIHPEGKTHYGPRVPAFIISPFVRPGAVDSTIFDHTSLLVTILHRFVGEIPRVFGPRVAAANHLGSALTGDRARAPATLGTQVGAATDQRLVETQPDPTDFHQAIATLGLPPHA